MSNTIKATKIVFIILIAFLIQLFALAFINTNVVLAGGDSSSSGSSGSSGGSSSSGGHSSSMGNVTGLTSVHSHPGGNVSITVTGNSWFAQATGGTISYNNGNGTYNTVTWNNLATSGGAGASESSGEGCYRNDVQSFIGQSKNPTAPGEGFIVQTYGRNNGYNCGAVRYCVLSRKGPGESVYSMVWQNDRMAARTYDHQQALNTSGNYEYKVVCTTSQPGAYSFQPSTGSIGNSRVPDATRVQGIAGAATLTHTVTEPPIISPRCTVSPTTARTGQNVTWTASASGGNGSYTYQWGGNVPNQDSRTVNTSYNTPGTKTGWVIITSGSRTSGRVNCSNSVNVSNPPPVASLEVRDNNANPSWGTGPITIDPIDEISLTWNRTNGAQNTVSCSGTNFNTGNANRGTQTNVTEPTEDQGSRTYRVICEGGVGTTPAQAQVTVNVRQGTGADIDIDKDRVRKDDDVNVTWDTGTSRPESCQIRIGSSVIVRSSLLNAPNPLAVTIPGEATITLDCPGGNDDSDSVQIIPEYQET